MNFRVLHYKTLDSTNNLARILAEQGASEGTVIVADYQTRGRGRFRRRWYSPRGVGLLFSVILRPRLQSSQASILTHMAAQSVRLTLDEEFRLGATLKRPNDVLVRGKKISGILTEASGEQRRLSHAIIGIGLNVNTMAKDLLGRATSIYLEKGRKFELVPILDSILSHLGKMYSKINHG